MKREIEKEMIRRERERERRKDENLKLINFLFKELNTFFRCARKPRF